MIFRLCGAFHKNWTISSWPIIRNKLAKTAKNAKNGVASIIHISAKNKNSENPITYLERQINYLSYEYT